VTLRYPNEVWFGTRLRETCSVIIYIVRISAVNSGAMHAVKTVYIKYNSYVVTNFETLKYTFVKQYGFVKGRHKE
jgi:hypothetical protein